MATDEHVHMDTRNPDTESARDAAIAVSHLVKRYPRAQTNAVDDVSFSVRRGEIFGLLGPNGAGKTTTIGVLTTFARATSGHAAILGLNVATHPMEVKQLIAVVPQQSNLDRSLKVREILTFHAAYHGVPAHERKARAESLLAELGLAGRANEMVSRYSGGMAQRLMIARALMHAPEVLFLDEPTNNLDPQSRLFLWDRIRALNAQGLTILLTTHDMDEADQLCDRIAIMDHGKVLVNDTGAELKKIIPGGIALEIRVHSGEQSGAAEHVADALRALPGVTQVEAIGASEGEPGDHALATYRLYGEDVAALLVPATQAVATSGAEMRDLHLQRPSLEDVFIYLTGRNLR